MTTPATNTAAPKMTAIEKALAAARAKKAQREAAAVDRLKTDAAEMVATEHDDGTVTLNEKVKKTKPAKEPKAAKEKPTDEAKVAAAAKREEERAAAKAQRDEVRAAKKAQKLAEAAAKKSAHMSKVDRAAAKLPPLEEAAKTVLEEVTSNLSLEQMTALALHIQHIVRRRSTEAAGSAKLEVGQTVRIVTSADPKFVGRTGTVTKAARLRCFVDVGGKKPAYLFVSDVVPA